MKNGTLDIDLKGTETKVETPKNWLAKIGSRLFGKKQYEQEIVTQMQYLQKTYNIFSELGYTNIVSLDLNGETVYEDEEEKDNDFQTAMTLAYAKVQKPDFETSMSLKKDKDTIDVSFSAKHEEGEYPLSIEVELDKTSEETTKFLEDVRTKINESFGLEVGDISVDENEESEEDEEDEEDEEVSEEETEETKDSEEVKE